MLIYKIELIQMFLWVFDWLVDAIMPRPSGWWLGSLDTCIYVHISYGGISAPQITNIEAAHPYCHPTQGILFPSQSLSHWSVPVSARHWLTSFLVLNSPELYSDVSASEGPLSVLIPKMSSQLALHVVLKYMSRLSSNQVWFEAALCVVVSGGGWKDIICPDSLCLIWWDSILLYVFYVVRNRIE